MNITSFQASSSGLAATSIIVAAAFSLLTAGCCQGGFGDGSDEMMPQMDPPPEPGAESMEQGSGGEGHGGHGMSGQRGDGAQATKGEDDAPKWTCVEQSFSGSACTTSGAWKALARSACNADGAILVTWTTVQTCEGGGQGVEFTCCVQTKGIADGAQPRARQGGGEQKKGGMHGGGKGKGKDAGGKKGGKHGAAKGEDSGPKKGANSHGDQGSSKDGAHSDGDDCPPETAT